MKQFLLTLNSRQTITHSLHRRKRQSKKYLNVTKNWRSHTVIQTKQKLSTAPMVALGLATCLSMLTLTSCASAPRKSAQQCIPVPIIPKDALQQKMPPRLNSDDDIVEYVLDLLHIIDVQNGSISLVRTQLESSSRLGCH